MTTRFTPRTSPHLTTKRQRSRVVSPSPPSNFCPAPAAYSSPSLFSGLPWSFPSDVFSIGCILMELFTGQPLFPSDDALERLAMMDVTLGHMPDHFMDRAVSVPFALPFYVCCDALTPFSSRCFAQVSRSPTFSRLARSTSRARRPLRPAQIP